MYVTRLKKHTTTHYRSALNWPSFEITPVSVDHSCKHTCSKLIVLFILPTPFFVDFSSDIRSSVDYFSWTISNIWHNRSCCWDLFPLRLCLEFVQQHFSGFIHDCTIACVDQPMHLFVQTPLLVGVPQGSVLGPVLFVMHAIIKQQAVITSRVCISGLLLFFCRDHNSWWSCRLSGLFEPFSSLIFGTAIEF